MKKELIFIAAASLAFSACVSTEKESPKDTKTISQTNPFQSFKSLKEAEKAAGFDFYLLDVFDDCAIQVYRAIPKQMLEAIYDSGSGDEIRIRKAPGKNDPSGDYNIYTERSSQTVGSTEIIFYASGNKCGKVVWHMGNYTCSITSRDKISLDKAFKTASKIIEMNSRPAKPTSSYER